MKIFIGVALIFLSSCAQYVKKMHKYFDREEEKPKRYSLYDKYRNDSYQKVTTGNRKFVSPGIKRYYQPQKNVVQEKKRRYTASDFDDNRSDGSIWLASSGRNRDFLFSKNVNVRSGDIVLVQVQEKLKSEITAELKRAFPLTLPPLDPNAPVPKEPVVPKAPPVEKPKVNDDKIFDVISSVVVDEINNNHLLVKGEKQILFRNQKRLVEVEALVNRQHIEPDGSLASNKIIETQIQVVRRLK